MVGPTANERMARGELDRSRGTEARAVAALADVVEAAASSANLRSSGRLRVN